MKLIFKGINILLSITLLAAAAGIAYVAIPYFGNQALIVRSGSMEPTIGIGSIVVVHPQKEAGKTGTSTIISPLASNSNPQPQHLASQGLALQSQYSVGDIIAFRSEKNSKTIITHRVVAVETGSESVSYKTKGDANEEPDGWTVSEKNIIGKSYITLPAAGRLLTFAKSKYGMPLLIIFPAALVIVLELISIISHIKKNRKKPFEDNFNNETNQINFDHRFSTYFTKENLTGIKALVPLILIVGLIIPIALAFPSDTETSTANLFQAASSFATPTPTLTPTPTGVQPGNVVINEIMWMGTQGDAADEWIELRNMTGGTIDLSNWVVDNLGSGVTNDIVIPSGKSIPPNGFFMIANDTKATGNHDVDPDHVTNISLQNPGEQLRLRASAGGTIIDTANGVGGWLAGEDPGGQNPEKSMERNNIPGDGTVVGSWHDATAAVNMDAGERELATPKAANGL